MTATFTGVVDPSASLDSYGEFGAIGGNLAGDAFTMTFTANERQPHTVLSGATYDIYQSLASASITINNTTVDIQDTSPTAVLNERNEPGSYRYSSIVAQTTPLTTSEDLFTELFGVIAVPFTMPGSPDYHSYALSGATWATPLPSSQGFDFAGDLYISTGPVSLLTESIGLDSDELTVKSVAAPPLYLSAVTAGAVPEPATWATMLIGLAAIGGAARSARRRRRALA